uniref:Uncharacterized protein n=1 Tax=Ralstonia solanacearum TaxID=305 RepID=A0A0S4X4V1_RALSL|nr:conserved protein of unknown function [Ralstonia solanacearum]CUV36664.1 conserved protein of unknown function [Ralstonia solanacearum]CUV42096.1 conserved protein of unknown function [Ralstonia solanacearum]CUV58539.1 conserved protein of unknown function [Ralstonia solanacearum]
MVKMPAAAAKKSNIVAPPHCEEKLWINISAKFAYARFHIHQKDGRHATVHCCRLRKTQRCFRCWARNMAATVFAPSRCRICGAAPPCTVTTSTRSWVAWAARRP